MDGVHNICGGDKREFLPCDFSGGNPTCLGECEGEVKLWNVANPQDQPEPLFLHKPSNSNNPFTGAVNSVAFSPDGHWLASASDDGTVKLYNRQTKKEWHTFPINKQVYSVAFSPDSKVLASGGADKKVRLWDVGTWKEKNTLDHIADVYAVAFSSDNKWLASASGYGEVKLWKWNLDTRSGGVHIPFYTENVYSIAFSPRRQNLGVGR